ncbi:MAG: IclR family transcriptional regulator [Chloroflexi bacterium]|nr:IclR family transcriptional regulator [Chloroflexota bacterium]
MKEKQKEERYNIRVLDRAISILSLLSDGRPRTLMEVSEGIDLSASTCFRMLSALASHNYIARDEASGQYSLGVACLELARSYQMSNHIRRVALPELEALRDETAETVHLAVLDRMEVLYLDKLPGLHAIGLMVSHVGGRVPSYCTGLGKALLAYTDTERVRQHFERTPLTRFTDTTLVQVDQLLAELQEIRRRGYALDRGEHEPDVRCVAAPIFDSQHKIAAAISIAGPSSRMEPLESNQERITRLLRAAQTISTQLGYGRTSHAENH